MQQAVGKGLKSLYVDQRGLMAPRRHNLNFLGTEVAIPSVFGADLTDLNATFDMTRYPDPLTGRIPEEIVTKSMAEQHIAEEKEF